MNSKVSVITVTYNALEGLQKTVESVSLQKYHNLEHIIVDGGSEDGTREYLQKINEPVIWISEPDNGIADAMNKGVAMSDGEWLLFLNSDDTFYNNNCLKRALESSENYDLISCDVLLTEGPQGDCLRKARAFGWLTNFKMTSPHQGLLIRRSLFNNILGFNEKYRIAMDYDFLIRAKKSGASMLVRNLILSNMPANGVSTRRDWGSISCRLKEDRKLQWSSSRPLGKVILYIFWTVYFPFKWSKHKVFGDGE